MNETSFIRSIHRHLAKYADVDIWKINDTYAGGVPDAVYFGDGRTLWVEYKYVAKLPKRDTTHIDLCNTNKYLSKNQQAWLKQKNKHGHNVGVIVGCPSGIQIYGGVSWMTPNTRSAYINTRTPKDIANYIHTAIAQEQNHNDSNEKIINQRRGRTSR